MNRKLLCAAMILMLSVGAFLLVLKVNAGPQYDLTGDGHVGMADVNIVLDAFGTFNATIGGGTAHPRWNATADVDINGIVNMVDVTLVLSEFGL